MFRLLFHPSDGTPFERRLAAGESMIVGRSSTVDVTLNDPLLSRQHARLRVEDGRLFVTDLGSRNGTMLGGERIAGETAVAVGDRVILGSCRVEVEPAVSTRASIGPAQRPLAEGTILRPAAELLGSGVVRADEATSARLAARLRLLHSVHEALARSLELPELVRLVLDRAFDHLRPERGVIFLKDGDGDWKPVAVRSVSGREEEIQVSRSLVAEVGEKGNAALVLDAASDARFAEAQSLMISGIRSLVAAPLADAEGTLGMIVLDSTVASRRFGEEDLELLATLASAAALKIRNLSLAEEAAARRRLEQELALARRIQEGLLPSRMPQLPGWSILARNKASRGVSGDFFQFFPRVARRELGIVIADVSGKGIAAALLMAAIEALAEAPVEDGLPPDEICTRLSRGIFKRTPTEKYATAIVAVLDPASGTLRYVNAGHNPAIVARADGRLERLGPTGVPLGLLEKAAWRCAETTLASGDMLVLYTDGITEAENPDEEEYGLARLEAIVGRSFRQGVDLLADEIARDLAEFARGVPFHDDRTLVLVGRSGEHSLFDLLDGGPVPGPLDRTRAGA